jgi:hypothetical protein
MSEEGSPEKELTPERLAELFKFPHNIQVEEVRLLISMALRSVSIATLRSMGDWLDEDDAALSPAKARIAASAIVNELRPAVEALIENGEHRIPEPPVPNDLIICTRCRRSVQSTRGGLCRACD